ncbi:glycosyltransferase family 4 protein [Frateuria sp. Soil773]|uniref:glycosyltransferase family 4 protein n=1 Tax=Frateuria sp. Soil773 TaxID=1736407 RepID=UPI00138F7A82|nr:glycosyltransferase family 4 protein [Frateuria sp. Soil773]
MSAALRVWLPAIRAGSGADVFVQRLADGLMRAGHEPCVQWFDHHYELTPWRLTSFDPPAGTDVVHANSWQAFAFKRDGIPLIVTEHQYVAHPAFASWQGRLQRLYHRWFIEPCMRRSFHAADAVVAVSEFCAASMRMDLSKPVTVIHNWIDADQFSPTPVAAGPGREQKRPIKRPFRLLFVGNPSRRKGADLLPAIAGMLGAGFELHCLGGLREGFRSRHRPPNMRLVPRIAPKEMPAVYHSVDAVLVPSRYEPFGYVALEAMACGLPVIGFSSTGTAEICEHGKTALLAKVDDVRQLVAYARELASDRSLGLRLGQAGRLRAVECFGEEAALSAYLKAYRSVLFNRTA